jgi:hypothetical protein
MSTAVESKATRLPRIPSDEYHARQEISCSMVKVFCDSQRKYQKRFVEKTMQRQETKSMTIGTLAHACILEPHLLEGHCVRIPPGVLNDQGHRRGKLWTEFRDAHEGKTLITEEEYETLQAMFDAVYQNEFCASFLLADGGVAESTILWEYQCHPLRSRLDLELPEWIIDVKTCVEGTPEDFAKGGYSNYRYALQAAFYIDAAKAIDGVERKFAFVCVENQQPHRAFVCIPDDIDIAEGRDEYRTALEMIAECSKANDWRESHELTVNHIRRPEWKKRFTINSRG